MSTTLPRKNLAEQNMVNGGKDSGDLIVAQHRYIGATPTDQFWLIMPDGKDVRLMIDEEELNPKEQISH